MSICFLGTNGGLLTLKANQKIGPLSQLRTLAA